VKFSSLRARKSVAALSLLACGVVVGGAATAIGPANASAINVFASGSGETPLTGDALAKVKAAVLTKYPNATSTRVETDSDGVYEAHIVTAAGENLTVELDNAYAITGPESGKGRGGRHGGAAETPLTGDALAKVKAAVLAEYPNATFTRVETDSDGVYEAHIVTAAGENLTVELDKAYAITGTE
jgi:uncharacterized membrane protein YkoI